MIQYNIIKIIRKTAFCHALRHVLPVCMLSSVYAFSCVKIIIVFQVLQNSILTRNNLIIVLVARVTCWTCSSIKLAMNVNSEQKTSIALAASEASRSTPLAKTHTTICSIRFMQGIFPQNNYCFENQPGCMYL